MASSATASGSGVSLDDVFDRAVGDHVVVAFVVVVVVVIVRCFGAARLRGLGGGDAGAAAATRIGGGTTSAALDLRGLGLGLEAGQAILGQAAHDDRDVRRALEDLAGAATGAGLEALLRAGLVGVAGRNKQLFTKQLVVVLGVGDRRIEQLADDGGGVALAELEHFTRRLHVEAANEIEHDADLAGRAGRVAQDGTRPFAFVGLGSKGHDYLRPCRSWPAW